jgi:hypothetical protein
MKTWKLKAEVLCGFKCKWNFPVKFVVRPDLFSSSRVSLFALLEPWPSTVWIEMKYGVYGVKSACTWHVGRHSWLCTLCSKSLELMLICTYHLKFLLRRECSILRLPMIFIDASICCIGSSVVVHGKKKQKRVLLYWLAT